MLKADVVLRPAIEAIFSRPVLLQWYSKVVSPNCPDAKSAADDFLTRASTEDVSPICFFDASWFRSKYKVEGRNAFLSYLGDERWRLASPAPFFAPRWYCRRYRLVRSLTNPLLHFLAQDELSPHPLIDASYLKGQSSKWPSGFIALDYLLDATKHRLKPHALFDGDWYLKQNQDVADAKMNPLGHYLYFGSAEGRSPNKVFNIRWYRDVFLGRQPKRIWAEPFTHYAAGGFARGASPAPGLTALTKASVKLTDHGPQPYIDCLNSDRSIYSSVGHRPDIDAAAFNDYMAGRIDKSNPLFPPRTLLLSEKRLAIMYTPKCASGKIAYWWIEQSNMLDAALRFTAWSHDFEAIFRSSRAYIADALSFDPDKYHVYKFVRNPLLRTVSSFAHLLTYPLSNGLKESEIAISFMEFLERLSAADLMKANAHFQQQVTDAEEAGKVSPRVLKLEDGMDAQLEMLEVRYGLPHARYSRHPEIQKLLRRHSKQLRNSILCGPNQKIPVGTIPNYEALLTADSIKKIYSIYRCDFEAYQYKLAVAPAMPARIGARTVLPPTDNGGLSTRRRFVG